MPCFQCFDFVLINDIIRIEADRSYVELILVEEKKMTVSRNLKDFEGVLPPSVFFRTHKSHLINVNRMEERLKWKTVTSLMYLEASARNSLSS